MKRCERREFRSLRLLAHRSTVNGGCQGIDESQHSTRMTSTANGKALAKSGFAISKQQQQRMAGGRAALQTGTTPTLLHTSPRLPCNLSEGHEWSQRTVRVFLIGRGLGNGGTGQGWLHGCCCRWGLFFVTRSVCLAYVSRSV